MRVLLTGACGVLGRTIRRVGAGEHEFVLLDLAEAVEAEGGLRGSFNDEELLMRAAAGCDAIIHTAAMHAAWVGKASDEEFINTNVGGAAKLFKVALKHGIKRIVCSSTMEILVGHDWLSHGTCILDEEFRPRPETIYPVSKHQTEVLGSYYAQMHGLEIVQLRYMSFSDRPIEKWGFRLAAQYVHADDAASANLLAMVRPNLKDEVFNIGPDTPLTQRDIHQAFKVPWGVLEKYWPGCREILLRYDERPNPEWFFPVTRIDHAKFLLGWKPRYTFGWWLRSLGWAGQESFDTGYVEKQ
jgi:nucleoside-diphosphate-sugar epimerase